LSAAGNVRIPIPGPRFSNNSNSNGKRNGNKKSVAGWQWQLAVAVGGGEPGKSQISNLQFSIFNAFTSILESLVFKDQFTS
jgi:hypothetical protein